MIEIAGQRYLEADEAAERLGVKPETLYAYVSRGLLPSFRRAVGRGRLYLEGDIERLLSLLPGREARPEASDQLGAGDAEPGRGDLPDADTWAVER